MKKFSIEYHETYGRTYEIEANSEEEAKENYKLNGKIVDSIESDYLEEDHYNLEIEKANE